MSSPASPSESEGDVVRQAQYLQWMRRTRPDRFVSLQKDLLEEKELRKWFRIIDADGGGTIDAEELEDPLTSLGLCFSSHEAEEIISRVNPGASTEISFTQFCDLMSSKNSKARLSNSAAAISNTSPFKASTRRWRRGGPPSFSGVTPSAHAKKKTADSLQKLLSRMKAEREKGGNLQFATLLASERRNLLLRGLCSYQAPALSPRLINARRSVEALEGLSKRRAVTLSLQSKDEEQARVTQKDPMVSNVLRLQRRSKRNLMSGTGMSATTPAKPPMAGLPAEAPLSPELPPARSVPSIIGSASRASHSIVAVNNNSKASGGGGGGGGGGGFGDGKQRVRTSPGRSRRRRDSHRRRSLGRSRRRTQSLSSSAVSLQSPTRTHVETIGHKDGDKGIPHLVRIPVTPLKPARPRQSSFPSTTSASLSLAPPSALSPTSSSPTRLVLRSSASTAGLATEARERRRRELHDSTAAYRFSAKRSAEQDHHLASSGIAPVFADKLAADPKATPLRRAAVGTGDGGKWGFAPR